MKPKTLLVLALVVAALGSFVWFYERRLPSSDERAERAKNVVALKTADVEAIEIAWSDQRVRLEREPAIAAASPDAASPPANWRLAAPLQATADRFAVERLVDSLTGLRKERTIEGADRKELGLESPRATVELTAKSGKTTLQIGSPLPASSSMAVAVLGESQAHVVSGAVWADLTKPAGDWRSKDLFTGTRDAIERLALETGGQRVLLAKRGEEFWLETPLSDRADRDAVGRLLGEVTGLRATAFLDVPPASLAEMGLEPPQGIVEAVLEGKPEPFRIELGGPVPATAPVEGGSPPASRRFARHGGLLFETESTLLESLAKTPAAWRSLAWSGLEVYRIDKASFADAAGAIEVERDGPDWKRGADTISFTPVSDLLYALTGARAERLAEKREVAVGQAEITVTLTASDKTVETLSLHPALANGEVPATASGRETVLMLGKSAADDVRSKLETLRKAEPLPEPANAEKTP